MKSAPWLLTLVIPLALSACSKESKATAGKDELTAPATPVEPETVPTDKITIDPSKLDNPPGDEIKDAVQVAAENPPPMVPVSKGIKKQPPPDPKQVEPKEAPPQAPQHASRGQNVDRPTYTVAVATSGSYAAGKPGAVTVTLTPKAGWKVNLDFPTKLEVTAPADVTLASAKLKKDDAASFGEKGATFRVTFTPGSAGVKEFKGKFKFVICNDDSCDPSTEDLSWKVGVN
jgi:hypothetical protein